MVTSLFNPCYSACSSFLFVSFSLVNGTLSAAAPTIYIYMLICSNKGMYSEVTNNGRVMGSQKLLRSCSDETVCCHAYIHCLLTAALAGLITESTRKGKKHVPVSFALGKALERKNVFQPPFHIGLRQKTSREMTRLHA